MSRSNITIDLAYLVAIEADSRRYQWHKENPDCHVRTKLKGKVTLYQLVDDGEATGGWRMSYDEVVDNSIKDKS